MTNQLLNPTEIRELAAKLGLKPTKKLGQNFVIDQNMVEKIVRTSNVSKDSIVLEVGPGLGSLTLALMATGAKVIAVEIDERLAELLPNTAKAKGFGESQLIVINKDALEISKSDVNNPDVLVANLPYNVSVPVIIHILETFPSIKNYLVMVQSEVADRLAASPGSRTYGSPSVKLQWYAEVSKAGSISRNVFWPVPNVDSDLVQLHRRNNVDESIRKELFAVVDAAFSQRRKMLRSALSSMCGGSEKASEILESVQIDPRLRGEALNVSDYVRLTEGMKKSGVRITSSRS
ncbi:MAG: 16S rRNA (adenine(1518)-N(6)/adenine(1519)-N(6))-dimethyltransferase RsmA [Candidatus Nanopelagicales bacterium]|nr:16S rRNA (adenine(1518)-N(6)/adenine(1519)-N(6))-dimethyltransferase RsmA [Candidatus Nanopelagicales bacterium]MDP4746743.1 16S rRNA (adenine(1518)-N(6)/adenine(1519)-N(6))-dimethyltransferase RsmA [Candidatus Nanopelagicales bacterium]